MSGVSDPSAATSHRRGPHVGRFGDVDSTRLPGLVTVAALTTTGALAATSLAGPGLLAGLLGILALIVALGWPILSSPPALGQVQVGLAVGGLLIAATVGLTTGSHRLVWLPVAVAIGMLVSFFLQLLRSDDRHGLTEAMSVVATGLACVGSGAALVPLILTEPGVRSALIGLAGLAAGVLAELTGRMPRVGAKAVFVVMLAGGLGGWLAAVLLGSAGSAGLGAGMLLASFSYSARRIFGAVPGSRETPGQVALGVATVLLPTVLLLALGALAKVYSG